ncbi:enoyl-CoA hydratase-related protein [Sneathiella marina]|uniref:Enoyl-CoA hydratase-related protein n=1 Tax=Sneathiella marina TaxID=2950108 RepID=A0ABY4WB43_9PROT|nr:enoyl-CoA hydratase-related protein [Sneathiella marina]USG62479.1 enoyl-CoA hydratase-related protein [Sneathiella marina]
MGAVLNLDKKDGVFTITINRPERRNALNEAVATGIMEALDQAEKDPTIRAVVLTGSGSKAFCAGGDLQPNAEGTPFAIEAHDPQHYVPKLFQKMEACRLPLIAKVNGHALAGGFGIVCGCDLVVARDDALIGVTEVKVGLFPMMILPFLLRVTPTRILMEMCLTGEPLTAGDAINHHLINYAVPADELDSKMDWLLKRITVNSPTGIRLGKQALAKIREMNFETALEYAPFMLANMARTKDAIEGFSAFSEKRRPEWTGR